MRVATIAVCILVLSAGCVGSSDSFPAINEPTQEVTETAQKPVHPTTPSSSMYDVDVDRIEDLIHEKINDRRVENGVEPIERNETLDVIARYKSWDMAQRDYFGHSGPNGTTHAILRDRYRLRCGHSGQNLVRKKFLGEKSYPYPQSKLSDSNQIAADIVRGLFNSSGHRENALSPNYDSQGIGVFVDENGTVFVTQELCG